MVSRVRCQRCLARRKRSVSSRSSGTCSSPRHQGKNSLTSAVAAVIIGQRSGTEFSGNAGEVQDPIPGAGRAGRGNARRGREQAMRLGPAATGGGAVPGGKRGPCEPKPDNDPDCDAPVSEQNPECEASGPECPGECPDCNPESGAGDGWYHVSVGGDEYHEWWRSEEVEPFCAWPYTVMSGGDGFVPPPEYETGTGIDCEEGYWTFSLKHSDSQEWQYYRKEAGGEGDCPDGKYERYRGTHGPSTLSMIEGGSPAQ